MAKKGPLNKHPKKPTSRALKKGGDTSLKLAKIALGEGKPFPAERPPGGPVKLSKYDPQ